MTELVIFIYLFIFIYSFFVAQLTMKTKKTIRKEARTSRFCYPWINDGTGAAAFPHWDVNQISTQSSQEVRAGISLTGHLVPERGHQGVDVATLIVMSPSSSLYKKKKKKKLGQLSIKGEGERGGRTICWAVSACHII